MVADRQRGDRFAAVDSQLADGWVRTTTGTGPPICLCAAHEWETVTSWLMNVGQIIQRVARPRWWIPAAYCRVRGTTRGWAPADLLWRHPNGDFDDLFDEWRPHVI